MLKLRQLTTDSNDTHRRRGKAASQGMPRAAAPPLRWATPGLEWTDEGHLNFSELSTCTLKKKGVGEGGQIVL